MLEESLKRKNRALSKLEKISLTYSQEVNFSEEEFEKIDDLHLSNKLIDMSINMINYTSLSSCEDSINLIRVDDIFSCSYLSNLSPGFQLPMERGYKNIIYHPFGVNPWKNDNPKEPLDLERIGNRPILLQLFVRGNPFKGDPLLGEPWKLVVEQLQSKGLLTALIVYGSIYLWEELIVGLDSSIPSAISPGQMPEAQRKILNTFFKSNKDTSLRKHNAIKFMD